MAAGAGVGRGGGSDSQHIWECPSFSALVDSLSGRRFLGRKSFFLRILRALIHCFLVSIIGNYKLEALLIPVLSPPPKLSGSSL